MGRARLSISTAFLDECLFAQGEARIIGVKGYEPARGLIEFIIEGDGLPDAHPDGTPRQVIAVITETQRKVEFHSVN